MKTIMTLCLLVLPLAAQPGKKAESFWEKVLRFTGVSATPRSLRSGENAASGDVWLVAAAVGSIPERLTRDRGYNSPVFDSRDQNILALKAGDLYRIPLHGDSPARVRPVPGVGKLVGISRDDPDQLLVLMKEAGGSFGAAVLSIKTGATTAIPHDAHSDQDETMLSHLAGWERDFGDVRLSCEDEEKAAPGGRAIRFTDVYLRRGSDRPIDLTNGNGVSSCQPSLSGDGKRVVFIREGP
jgi:hypothetical protein